MQPTFEQLLARQRSLSQLAGLAGRRDLAPFVQMAALSGDAALLKDLSELLQDTLLLSQAPLHPFPAMPPAEVSIGDLLLGLQLDGSPVMLRLEALTQHGLIVGPTGSGKSTLVKMLLKVLLPLTHVWLFDAHNEYHIGLGEEIRSGTLLVLEVSDLRRGLFEVLPGEKPRDALARISALFRRTTFVRDGGENIIRQALHDLYTSHGVFEGSEDYPTLEEFVGYMTRLKRRLPPRELEYWPAAWNRIYGLWLQMAETYNCVKGFPIPTLLERSVIFRTAGMNPLFQAFLCDDLLTCALTCRRLGNSG